MARLLFVAIALLVSACATITKGTTQAISITTPGVVDATCTLTSSAVGTKVVQTPATITVEKGRESIVVRCTKQCYTDGNGVIASDFEPMVAGNIILGGAIGLGVDAVSGAMNKYTPEAQVVMTPIPGCGAATPTARGKRG
jgi:hypothetical protein